MLLHQQYEDYIVAWKALEEAQEAGKIRSIGISNFNMKRTQEILDSAKIKPVINQVECHPYYQQNEMRRFLAENSIKMEVWYPLGHGDKKLLAEPLFSRIS
jgi:diketogulonate reductase-like aldo/keto reductase